MLKPGEKNVLAVEVHQAGPKSSDLYFDLAIKTLPTETAAAEVSSDVRDVVEMFNRRHYVGPETRIPDGYLDGGRGMKIDDENRAAAGREMLQVDRSRDSELADDLALARSAALRELPPLERAKRIAAWIDSETTPPAGKRLVEKTTAQLEQEFKNRPLLIGDWVEQCHAGVCRHRALLFKILADEAGLKTALVRGNYGRDKKPGFPHAWNELFLDDGRRLLVDVMHHGGEDKFFDVGAPEVVEHYWKVDDTPWYATKPADAPTK
ncbi:MAG: hypothetical protein QM775_00945 [Pirellulales bacterium]